MKTFPSRRSFRNLTLLATALALCLSFSMPAWAADDSGEERRDYPVFNIDLENPEIGDERQFLRGSARFTGRQLSDYQDACLELEPGRVYDLLICLHNAGDPELAPATTAENTVFNLYFPSAPIIGSADTSDSSIMAQLLADNTKPKSKSVSLRLSASTPAQIDSESIYLYRYDFEGNYLNDLVADFSRRPDSFGCHVNLGDIPGGEAEAGYIFVEFSTLPDEEASEAPDHRNVDDTGSNQTGNTPNSDKPNFNGAIVLSVIGLILSVIAVVTSIVGIRKRRR